MRKRAFRHELARYTRLNNACFRDYPYRTERMEEQDYRLFKPLKPFLDNENLIFAEYEGRPVGYLLWYPDLNETLNSWQLPGPLAAVNFRCCRKPDTFHFSEVAVLLRYQISMASYALIFKMAVVALNYGYAVGSDRLISLATDLSNRFYLEYGYDDVGNILTRRDNNYGSLTPCGYTEEYSYDEYYRLTGAVSVNTDFKFPLFTDLFFPVFWVLSRSQRLRIKD